MKPLLTILALGVAFISCELKAQTFTYKVKYGLVQAGTAKLIHHVEDNILNSFFVIESSPWLSTLWSLSDSVMTEYLLDPGRLVKHTKAIHEGNYHRNYEVTFSDSDLVLVNGNEKQVEIEGLRDVPSLLYELSHTRFKDGDTLRYRVWDGKSAGKLKLLVEKVGKPTLLRPFSEAGWRLTPLNSTRKSRANEIQLSMFYSRSFPHIPITIEIDTKYGNIQMRKEDP